MIPCSETESPSRSARSRSSTLCLAEPVKCWSRFPYASGSTILRSTESPLYVVTRVPEAPADPAWATSSCSVRAIASCFGSRAVAIRSMSLQVSARRRAEPATVTASLAGWARSAAASSSATGRTWESSSRSAGPFSPSVARAAITFSSAFGPSPLRSRIRCSSAAARRSSSVATPSSSYSRRTVFAPRPGIRVTSTREAGYFAFSFVAEGISPVSTRATIFVCSVSPIPGSSVAFPASASSSTETGLWRITRAASL